MKELDYMVTRTYNGDGSAPNTQIVNRYNATENYVPAVIDHKPSGRRPDLPVGFDVPMPTNGSEDALALRSLETTHETATPIGRALATNIRAAGLLVAVGLVALALYVAGAPTAYAAIGFACMLVAGYIWLSKLDHDHSPAGIERKKIAAYQHIRAVEIDAQREIAIAKVGAYIRVLEEVYGRPSDTQRES